MSDLLEREDLGEVERWQAPSVAAGSPESRAAGRKERPSYIHSARELEELQKRAWEEAWARGEADGRKAGEKAVRAEAQKLTRIAKSMARPLDEVDQAVEEELASLALAIARQVIRRELRTEPEHVIAAVREALEALPSNSREVRVHLHPDDARLVREVLANPEGEIAWDIREDPVLERGSCRVSSNSARVDATLESRIAEIATRVLGSDRARGGDAGDEDDQ
ncbi:flagellar assembly protein FliH [Wenzhouxiangella sp. AB-CW3]|uniref:flagellar assembly protein FliH n=1 Tax=Wenzhouxiangella sp. AB-CW3 TaxID=2771012 RepID=UPI00168A9456|nr:flagellar assembly protein FliH [Wenzhouxiangella sp. AB-CW3]QOC21202.1 flagellar assembly protein FliH [Wenzhouxiangella sp. AB-CW3]